MSPFDDDPSLWNSSDLRAAQNSVDHYADPADVAGSDEALVSTWSALCDHFQTSRTPSNGACLDVCDWATSLVGSRVRQYLVDEYLGHGGFGVVFRARDTELDREVALKLPRPERILDPSLRERVLNEARAAARLRHAGVVQVYDAGFVGPIVYIASELCDGMTLETFLGSGRHKQQPAISPRAAAKLLRDVADIMGYAHSRGIIHQDLKPANILLETSQRSNERTFTPTPRVTDFGLARRVTNDPSAASSSVIGGTRRYMAPEQIAEDEAQIGTHTDVYALGVILGEVLSVSQQGLSPSSQQSPMASTTAIDRPVKPKGVPQELWYVYLRCTEPNPSQRYHDGWTLRDDLERYLANQTVLAHPWSWRRAVRSWWNRRPITVLLISLLLLSITGGLTGTIIGFRQARSSLQRVSIAYGTLSHRVGNWDQSLKYFREATEYSPDLAVELDYIDTLVSLQRYAEADAALQKVKLREGSPRSVRVLLLDGELGLASGRAWSELAPVFQQAFDAAPANTCDSALAASMLAKTTPESIEWLKRAVSADPYCHLAHVKLLGGLFFMGRHDDAEAECRAIQLLFPEDWTPDAYLAFIELGRGNSVEADRHAANLRKKLDPGKLVDFEEEFRAFRTLADLAADEEKWSVATKLLAAVERASPGFRPTKAGTPPATVSVGFRRPILPTVTRAWQHLAVAVKHLKHESLPIARRQLEEAVALLPEGTLYQIHAAICLELNYANTDELVDKTVAATRSLQIATECSNLFPRMIPAAKELAVMGQYILGRSTRKVGKPDPEMRRLAIENISELLAANEIDPNKLSLFSSYASQLEAHELAVDVAEKWLSLEPANQAAQLFIVQQQTLLGRHEDALNRLKSVTWDEEHSDKATSLTQQCNQSLMALTR